MRKRFDEQLNELNQEMLQMGTMVEESIQEKPKDSVFTKILRFFANYGIFVLLPVIAGVIAYMIKVGKQKIGERKK